jgi:hypothetical protein
MRPNLNRALLAGRLPTTAPLGCPECGRDPLRGPMLAELLDLPVDGCAELTKLQPAALGA